MPNPGEKHLYLQAPEVHAYLDFRELRIRTMLLGFVYSEIFIFISISVNCDLRIRAGQMWQFVIPVFVTGSFYM